MSYKMLLCDVIVLLMFLTSVNDQYVLCNTATSPTETHRQANPGENTNGEDNNHVIHSCRKRRHGGQSHICPIKRDTTATCDGDPFVMVEARTCISIFTGNLTDGSDCATDEERERRQSLAQKAEECLEELFALKQCEDPFTAQYRGYVLAAYSQASTYRCAGDCRNDTGLNQSLMDCYDSRFSQDTEILDCELRYNQTYDYEHCIIYTLFLSGCATNFTKEWSESTNSVWQGYFAMCGKDEETSCFDNGEVFVKASQCREAVDDIQLVGFDLEEYCRLSLGTLKPCIENILSNLTCEEDFFQFIREVAYSDPEEFCSDQRICDHKVLQCLNSTAFTFSVDPSNYDVTCRNLHDALENGWSCLMLDFSCTPNYDMLQELQKSLEYHRGLYLHMCLAENNCIFDTTVMKEMVSCYDIPVTTESYCGSFETYLDEVKKCYTDILDEKSCSRESKNYYHNMYTIAMHRRESQCNARCTNTADTVISQIHACHESVTSNVDQLTSDLTYLSQKGNFCSSLKLQGKSLMSCVNGVFEVEWCEDFFVDEERASAALYTQMEDLLCNTDGEVIDLGLQCTSFKPMFDALLDCSKPIMTKKDLTKSSFQPLESATVCQDRDTLYMDAMQCLSSKLYALECPIELPVSLSDVLYNHTKVIHDFCADIPVVGGSNWVSASMTSYIGVVFLSWTVKY